MLAEIRSFRLMSLRVCYVESQRLDLSYVRNIIEIAQFSELLEGNCIFNGVWGVLWYFRYPVFQEEVL